MCGQVVLYGVLSVREEACNGDGRPRPCMHTGIDGSKPRGGSAPPGEGSSKATDQPAVASGAPGFKAPAGVYNDLHLLCYVLIVLLFYLCRTLRLTDFYCYMIAIVCNFVFIVYRIRYLLWFVFSLAWDFRAGEGGMRKRNNHPGRQLSLRAVHKQIKSTVESVTTRRDPDASSPETQCVDPWARH